jgi:hypothetical protein
MQKEKKIANRNYVLDLDIEKIMMSLNPETKDLPKDDRLFFESKVRYLIGKEIKLSNIPPDKVSRYYRRVQWVIKIMRFPQLFSKDYIRFQLVELLAKLGLQLSIDGLAWKYGFMGFQSKTEHYTQELINVPTEEGTV